MPTTPSSEALAEVAPRGLEANDQVRLAADTSFKRIVALEICVVTALFVGLGPMLAVPLVAGGLVMGAVPLAASFVGRARLRRARAAQRTQRSSAEFATLARASWASPGVRCDAAAHAALVALERGNLEEALREVATPARDSHQSVRARTPSIGYYGEAVRSLFGWLFPEAQLEPLSSTLFRPEFERNDPGYPATYEVVAALRVMEAVHATTHGTKIEHAAVVRRAWNELDGGDLCRQFPLLRVLVLEVAVRVDPGLGIALRDGVAALDGVAAAAMRRRFPGPRPEREGGVYRAPAAESTALQRGAPAGLQALNASESPTRWLLPTVSDAAWFPLAGLAFLVTAAGAGSVAYLVGTALMLSVWGIVRWRRRTRVAPLRKAGIDDPDHLDALSAMAARNGPYARGLQRPHAFDRGELMIIVGLWRAEQALLRSDLDEARAQIGWWLEGLDSVALATIDMHAILSSALRLAVLLGYRDTATRLAARGTRRWDRGHARTARGNAPQAVWLARALHCWSDNRLADAALATTKAMRKQPVVWGRFEVDLYGELLRRLADRGYAIETSDRVARGAVPAWVRAVWPDGHAPSDPAEDREAQRSTIRRATELDWSATSSESPSRLRRAR